MDADEVLTTTRAVRRRLDLRRPVPMELIAECIEVALQAPSGGNRQPVRTGPLGYLLGDTLRPAHRLQVSQVASLNGWAPPLPLG